MKINFEGLSETAKKIRLRALEMQQTAGKGHLGGALSVVEILLGLYYTGVANISPKNFKNPARDRIIFSKGHACLSFYAVLADRGFFPEAELKKHGADGTFLGSHPDHFIPGVEISSGSLGHGLGIGAGMALSAKLNNQKYTTYVILGDGECNEGSVWEAASFATSRRLNNLVAIIDNNGVSATSRTQEFTGPTSLADKWKSFGWETVTVDGHNIAHIVRALQKIKRRSSSRQPFAIVARTIKGKGVSFMEGNPAWHHGVANKDQFEKARIELL